MMHPPAPILSLLSRKNTFVLTTHVNPDGDGLGSQVALSAWLALRGAAARIINADPVPLVYDFLGDLYPVETYDPGRHADPIRDADAILVLDTNQPGRLGALQNAVMASQAAKVIVDHHRDPADFADQVFIDGDATSTGEMIYTLLADAGALITPAVATALYTAIMTDTGSFRYPRTDAETHQIVAHLVRSGADPVEIYRKVHERWTPGRMRLLGEMLAGLETACEGQLAIATITLDLLRSTGTTVADTDTFSSYPMGLAGVRTAILLVEQPESIKVSFRSRDDIPMHRLAREFGGGGHLNAAGAQISGLSIAEARKRVQEAARKYLTMPSDRSSD